MAAGSEQARPGSVTAGAAHLETAAWGPPPDAAPTIVLLHEGLGCVRMWGAFAAQLAAATGMGVVAYSRAGYGGSDPVALPRPPTYMHEEAQTALPAVLERIGFRRGLLLGHSDGASIAAIYLGSRQDHRVRGLVLLAPHFFVDDISIASIAAAREAYLTGDLRPRLAKYHGANVECAFRGWNDAWLDPAFRSWDIREHLAYIRVPMLIVQGRADRYGTLAQVRAAEEEAMCPVEVALLDGAGHAPHLEQPAETLRHVAGFVRRLMALEGEPARLA